MKSECYHEMGSGLVDLDLSQAINYFWKLEYVRKLVQGQAVFEILIVSYIHSTYISKRHDTVCAF